jgi:hypothetical protein
VFGTSGPPRHRLAGVAAPGERPHTEPDDGTLRRYAAALGKRLVLTVEEVAETRGREWLVGARP